MADGISFVFDLPNFNAALDALSLDMEQKVMRAATRAATTVFLTRAQQYVHVLKSPRKNRIQGLLKRLLYVTRSRDRSAGREHYVLAVKSSGKGTALGKAFYWRWVEEGHLARGRGTGLRGGKRSKAAQRAQLAASGAKRVKAYPYLKTAFDTGKNEALDVFYSTVEKRLAKANAKGGR